MTTAIEEFAATAQSGSQLLAELRTTRLSKDELAVTLAISRTEASLYFSVAKTFDAEELAYACERKLSFSKMRLIARTERQLANPDVDRRKVRIALMDFARNASVDELKEHITHTIAELNDGHNRCRKWYLRYSSQADADGMRHLIMKLPSHIAARMAASLEPQATHLAATGEAVDKAEGHARALVDRVLNGYDLSSLENIEEGENPDNPRDVRQRPCFLVPIAEITENVDGTITNTDGETINLQDMVDAKLAEFGFAVVSYKDRNGIARPQKVFEVKRLADADDRFLSIVSHLVCQNPHCRIPAVRCEIHHITAYSRGGTTTADNLCPLCREHNLHNDDNPRKPLHGRVITDPKTGLTWYKLPDGTITRNRSNANQRNALHYTNRILAPDCDHSWYPLEE